jgi:hypothetical protein
MAEGQKHSLPQKGLSFVKVTYGLPDNRAGGD